MDRPHAGPGPDQPPRRHPPVNGRWLWVSAHSWGLSGIRSTEWPLELQTVLDEKNHFYGVEAEAQAGEGACPRAQHKSGKRVQATDALRNVSLVDLAHGLPT